MRKLALLFLSLLVAGIAQAQIQKGDVQLSGTFFWSSQDQGTADVSTLNIQPSSGLFLSDKTSLGLILGIRSNSREVPNGNPAEFDDNLFQYGVYARFHKNLGEKFYFFLQPSLMLGSGNSKIDNTTVRETDTFAIALAPGLTYFLTDKWALEMSIGALQYNRTQTDESGTERTNTAFNMNLNLANVGFGLSFYIR